MNFGQIFVSLDKDSYAPGDQANGFIHLNLFTNYPSNTVTIMIAGVEETKLAEAKWVTHDEYLSKYRYHGKGQNFWGFSKYKEGFNFRFDYWDDIPMADRRTPENGTETRKIVLDHYQYKPVFNHKFPIYQFPGVFIPAGQYSFPVSFILPQGMPASFNHEFEDEGQRCYADINYTMTASLDMSGFSLGTLSSTQNFVVNQAIKGDGTVRSADISKQVKQCCCIDKGEVHIKAYFERSDYMSGEEAVIIAEVNCEKCTVDVQSLDGIFRQYLTITAGTFTKNISKEINHVSLTGIQAGEKKVGADARRLNLTLKGPGGVMVQPSANGNLIKNRYSLETKTKMSVQQCCGKSPTASIEANIFNRPIPRNVWAQPPNWQPQMMNAYTCNFSSQFAFSGDFFAGSNMNPAGAQPMPGGMNMNMPGMNINVNFQTNQY